MSELVEFLRACLDEDEATANNHLVFEVRDGRPGNYAIPERVLAQVEAHRRIVEAFADDPWCLDGGYVYTEFALRALASVYADRPGYREEWRP